MDVIEVTSMSSRGQIVIPKEIRNRMDLDANDKFIVYEDDDTIVLKKIKKPNKNDFTKFKEMVQKTRKYAKNSGISEKDLEKAIKESRSK